MFNIDKQISLFQDWKLEIAKLESLSGIIQNDFNRLKADGLVKENFIAGINTFDWLFDKYTKQLFQKKQEIDEFLTTVLEKLRKKRLLCLGS